MSIRVEESFAERNGTRNKDGISDYKRVYNVISTNVLTEDQALVATDTTSGFQIPAINSSHFSDTKAKTFSVSASPKDGDNKTWTVNVGWQTQLGSGSYDDEENTTDPTTQRPEVSYGHATYTKVMSKAYQDGDTYGNPTLPVENTAEDPFDPPITQDSSLTIIELNYNTRSFDPDWMRQYENTINKSAVRVGGARIPALQGRIVALDADPLYDDNDELYWKVSCQIELNSSGFTAKILNQGFNFLDSGTKRPIIITKKDETTGKETKVVANDPQKLALDGTVLAVGGTPVYRDFNVYWRAEWKALNLPASY